MLTVIFILCLTQVYGQQDASSGDVVTGQPNTVTIQYDVGQMSGEMIMEINDFDFKEALIEDKLCLEGKYSKEKMDKMDKCFKQFADECGNHFMACNEKAVGSEILFKEMCGFKSGVTSDQIKRADECVLSAKWKNGTNCKLNERSVVPHHNMVKVLACQMKAFGVTDARIKVAEDLAKMASDVEMSPRMDSFCQSVKFTRTRTEPVVRKVLNCATGDVKSYLECAKTAKINTLEEWNFMCVINDEKAAPKIRQMIECREAQETRQERRFEFMREGVMVKKKLNVPQIIRVIKAKSVAGLSKSSLILEFWGYSMTVSYSVYNSYAYNLWAEYPFLIIQDLVIFYLVIKSQKNEKNTFLKLYIPTAILIHILIGTRAVPSWFPGFIITATMPFGFISRILQLYEIISKKDPGHVSALTWFMNSVSCFCRLSSIGLTVGDVKLMTRLGLAVVLNFCVCLSVLYYGKSSVKKSN